MLDRTRSLLLTAVAVAAAAVGLAAWSTDVLRRPELATVDARFDLRGRQDPPPGVVVVGLDEATLRRLNVQPPIPRRFHARVINRLRAAGAAVIAYDFEFAQPTTASDDGALIRAVRRAGNVVLATTRVSTSGDVDVLDGSENVRAARAVAGSTSFPPRTARGGVIRRVVRDERGVPSFAVAAARIAGRPAPRDRFEGDGAWIDFAGPAGTIEAFPMHRVLAGEQPAGGFTGKVVVVGATAPVLHDVHAVATGPGMPGAEVNANAIATILDGFPLGDAPGWLAGLLVALAGIATPVAALRLRGLRWLPIPAGVAAILAAATYVLFEIGTIVPVAAPALALVVGAAGTLAVAYATDVRDRRRLRAAFRRFVPPQVVDDVVAQADGAVRLGGVSRDATVLFCDLRAFTTIAEHLAPQQVIELLTCHLTEMSDAILDRGGTVVSYMGDGIMAVFGAPLPQADHADRALAAAQEMLGPRLERVNAWAAEHGILRAAGGRPLRIGIGVCSGPVMSGNVGSLRRLEYAAVGDTTNVAARLEAMTKDAGCAVLIADATRVALRRAPPELRRVGRVALRGRSAPLTAWTFGDERG